jgi:hypothetical protein
MSQTVTVSYFSFLLYNNLNHKKICRKKCHNPCVKYCLFLKSWLGIVAGLEPAPPEPHQNLSPEPMHLFRGTVPLNMSIFYSVVYSFVY